MYDNIIKRTEIKEIMESRKGGKAMKQTSREVLGRMLYSKKRRTNWWNNTFHLGLNQVA